MTDKAISPLRRRLIEDMTIRRLGPGTQHQYIRHVKSFADFVGHSPDKATPEDVRRYQLRLASIDYVAGKKDQAYKRVDEVIKEKPNFVDAHVAKVRMLLADGNRAAEARKQAEAAVKADAGSASAQYAFGPVPTGGLPYWFATPDPLDPSNTLIGQ